MKKKNYGFIYKNVGMSKYFRDPDNGGVKNACDA